MKKLIILLAVVIMISGCSTPLRTGATVSSHTFCLWNDPALSFTAITNAYVMLVNDDNGDMYDADATSPTVTTTYAEAAIVLTADAQNTEWACGTIPACDSAIDPVLCVFENATPTLGDTIKAAYKYDPKFGTFTDTNPIKNNRIRSINE